MKREVSYRQEQSWLRKMLGFWKESVFYQVPWEAIAEKLLNEKYCFVERARSCRNALKGEKGVPALTLDRSSETPLVDRQRLLLRKWWRLLAHYAELCHTEGIKSRTNAPDALCPLSPVLKVDDDIKICQSRLQALEIQGQIFDGFM
jgi:hypothetical protein